MRVLITSLALLVALAGAQPTAPFSCVIQDPNGGSYNLSQIPKFIGVDPKKLQPINGSFPVVVWGLDLCQVSSPKPDGNYESCSEQRFAPQHFCGGQSQSKSPWSIAYWDAQGTSNQCQKCDVAGTGYLSRWAFRYTESGTPMAVLQWPGFNQNYQLPIEVSIECGPDLFGGGVYYTKFVDGPDSYTVMVVKAYSSVMCSPGTVSPAPSLGPPAPSTPPVPPAEICDESTTLSLTFSSPDQCNKFLADPQISSPDAKLLANCTLSTLCLSNFCQASIQTQNYEVYGVAGHQIQQLTLQFASDSFCAVAYADVASHYCRLTKCDTNGTMSLTNPGADSYRCGMATSIVGVEALNIQLADCQP